MRSRRIDAKKSVVFRACFVAEARQAPCRKFSSRYVHRFYLPENKRPRNNVIGEYNADALKSLLESRDRRVSWLLSRLKAIDLIRYT